MEFFPNGCFVRLQNRATRRYIHSDGDWVGVSLRLLSPVPSLEAVWRAEHWVSDQWGILLVLQNAAYGRYLSYRLHLSRRGHLNRRVVQRDLDDPNLVPAFVWWSVRRVNPGQDYVRLRQFNFHLFADGRYLTWLNALTGNRVRRRRLRAMTQWTVHPVAATPVPLPLPQAEPPEPPLEGGHRHHSFWAFWRRNGYGPVVYPQVERKIRHVRANDEGAFDLNLYNWPSFSSYGLTLFDLRFYLGQLQHDCNGNLFDFTLCILPSSHGRLMPLCRPPASQRTDHEHRRLQDRITSCCGVMVPRDESTSTVEEYKSGTFDKIEIHLFRKGTRSI